MNTRKFASILPALALAVSVGATPGETTKYATDPAGFIPYWVGLGPISIPGGESGGSGLDVKYLQDEAGAMPVAGDKAAVNGKDFTWKAVTVQAGTPIVNGEQAFGKGNNLAAYMVSYIVVDKDDAVSISWGSDDSAAVFVNGKEVGRYVGGRGCGPDQNQANNVQLKKGVNVVMMKILNGQGGWGGCMRILASDGFPGSAGIVPAPAGKKGEDWKVVSTGQKAPNGPVGTYIVVGQIGYSRTGEKLAIAATVSEKKWNEIAVCDAKTDKIMFTIPKDGGSIVDMGQRKDVNQYITRIFFGPFKTPGRYYLYSKEYKARSLRFNIADDVFVDTAKAATKMLYYQRYGQAFDAKCAGKWVGPSYHNTAPALTAMVHEAVGGNWLGIGGKVLDPTPRDVRGGWYDAGDPNKYTGNESEMHDWLLVAYDMNKKYMKDGDLNIPESGNKVPDIVDEARYTTDYFMRIQKEDGAIFDRVAHGDGNGQTQIAEACSGATLCGIASLAYAGAVWKEGGWDKAYADKVIAAAEKSWKLLQTTPPVWPLGANGKMKNLRSISGDYGGEKNQKGNMTARAAAALYRATGKEEYKNIIEPYLKGLGGLRVGWNGNQIVMCNNYSFTPGHDPAIVAEFGKKLAGDVAALKNDVSPKNGKHPYNGGCRDGYYWGSNGALSSHAAQMAWWAWKFAPKEEQAAYAQAAEEYLQYITGRNVHRWCFLTSLQDIGAENSIQVMFHFLCRNDKSLPGGDNKWITPDEAHPGRTGCYPGFVVGGVTDGIMGFGFDPKSISGDWVHMEPSIIYQAGVIPLANYCAYVAREHRPQ